MNYSTALNMAPGKAICYSGFRDGQRPGGVVPSYEEIKEDLLMLHNNWQYLRLYDCDPHAETVLEVIQKENFNFKIMLGAYIVAEANNYGCPWGGTYSEDQLQKNKLINRTQINKLIDLANKYPEIIWHRISNYLNPYFGVHFPCKSLSGRGEETFTGKMYLIISGHLI